MLPPSSLQAAQPSDTLLLLLEGVRSQMLLSQL